MESLSSKPASARILVAEDDADLREAVRLALSDEGYQVQPVAALSAALEMVERDVFQLILTDLFSSTAHDPLSTVEALRNRAQPTPVAVTSGWEVTEEEVRRRGFAFFLAKPFELDDLFTRVAECLNASLTSEQERQAAIVQRYFAALNARDWDGIVNLCAEQVVHEPPRSTAYGETTVGRARFRAYIESVVLHVPDVQVESIAIYGLPQGLAVRQTSRWALPDGRSIYQSGAVVFHFEGELISRIGVRMDAGRVRARLEK